MTVRASRQATTNRRKARADAKFFGKLPRKMKKRQKRNLKAELRTARGFVIYRWRVRYSPERGWWIQKTLRTQYRELKDSLV